MLPNFEKVLKRLKKGLKLTIVCKILDSSNGTKICTHHIAMHLLYWAHREMRFKEEQQKKLCNWSIFIYSIQVLFLFWYVNKCVCVCVQNVYFSKCFFLYWLFSELESSLHIIIKATSNANCVSRFQRRIRGRKKYLYHDVSHAQTRTGEWIALDKRRKKMLWKRTISGEESRCLANQTMDQE